MRARARPDPRGEGLAVQDTDGHGGSVADDVVVTRQRRPPRAAHRRIGGTRQKLARELGECVAERVRSDGGIADGAAQAVRLRRDGASYVAEEPGKRSATERLLSRVESERERESERAMETATGVTLAGPHGLPLVFGCPVMARARPASLVTPFPCISLLPLSISRAEERGPPSEPPAFPQVVPAIDFRPRTNARAR